MPLFAEKYISFWQYCPEINPQTTERHYHDLPWLAALGE